MCTVNIGTVTSRTQGKMANLSLLFHVWLLTVCTETVRRIIFPRGCSAWPVQCKCWQCVQKMSAIAFSFLDIYSLKTAPTEISWTSLLDTAVYPEPCAVLSNPASLFSAIKWTLCASGMLSCLQWWDHTTQSSLCVLGSICVCLFFIPHPPRLVHVSGAVLYTALNKTF